MDSQVFSLVIKSIWDQGSGIQGVRGSSGPPAADKNYKELKVWQKSYITIRGLGLY